MAKYLDFHYREDTYGERSRPQVPIRFIDAGYDINAVGDTVPNFSVEVGPISWSEPALPTGWPNRAPFIPRLGRVMVLKSTVTYPAHPDTFLIDQTYDENTDFTDFTYADNESILVPDGLHESGKTYRFRAGSTLGKVVPGSVIYISVFTREPFWDDKAQRTIWLPWDPRGRAFFVVPGNYGGVAAARNAMPRAVLTEGLVYGEHIDNPTTAFVSALGYVMDTVITDGELISAPVDRMHPNIVLPRLRGFGMSPDEEVFFTDRMTEHRLRSVLLNYRSMTAAKGTLSALSRYVELCTGYESLVVGPVNHLLDRSDTCPDDPRLIDASGNVARDQFTVETNAANWWLVPSDGWHQGYTGGKPVYRRPVNTFLADNTTRDPWYDPKNPAPATEWVHRIRCAGPTRFGSRLDPSYYPLASPGEYFTLRFRYWATVAAGDVWATIKFYDKDGALLDTEESIRETIQVNDWHDYRSGLAMAPPGTKYLSWEVNFDTTQEISLGAIQLTGGGSADKYRNPRAMAVIIDTGPPPLRNSWVTMDSGTVDMDDTNVLMDDGRTFDIEDQRENLLIMKLRPTLNRYVPAGVDIEIITSSDIEFTRYFAGDRI